MLLLLILQKRALRFIYFSDRRDHAIPLFLNAHILPINFMHYKLPAETMPTEVMYVSLEGTLTFFSSPTFLFIHDFFFHPRFFFHLRLLLFSSATFFLSATFFFIRDFFLLSATFFCRVC